MVWKGSESRCLFHLC